MRGGSVCQKGEGRMWRLSKVFAVLKPKRRWFQFSLQKILVVVTLFAYGLGWLVIWFDEPEAKRRGYSTSVVNGRIYVLGGMAPLGSGGQIHGL